MGFKSCHRCGKASVPGRCHCAPCAAIHREQVKSRQAGLTSRGLCRQQCGREVVVPNTKCEACRSVLREIKTQQRSRWLSEGLCRACGTLRLPCSNHYCETCQIKQACRMHGRSAAWQTMRQRWVEQGSRCYLCRIPISLGPETHLERMVPKSRTEFGTDSQNIDYWRWSCASCNRKKQDLTAWEFWSLYSF